MSNITDMEKQLHKLDKEDEDGGEATNWRNRNRYHEEGMDTTKIDLLKKLMKIVPKYGGLAYLHLYHN